MVISNLMDPEEVASETEPTIGFSLPSPESIYQHTVTILRPSGLGRARNLITELVVEGADIVARRCIFSQSGRSHLLELG